MAERLFRHRGFTIGFLLFAFLLLVALVLCTGCEHARYT